MADDGPRRRIATTAPPAPWCGRSWMSTPWKVMLASSRSRSSSGVAIAAVSRRAGDAVQAALARVPGAGRRWHRPGRPPRQRARRDVFARVVDAAAAPQPSARASPGGHTPHPSPPPPGAGVRRPVVHGRGPGPAPHRRGQGSLHGLPGGCRRRAGRFAARPQPVPSALGRQITGDPPPPPLRPLRPAVLYQAPPRTKLEATVPDGQVTGKLEVRQVPRGHRVRVAGDRGEHADSWVWLHAAGFGAAPGHGWNWCSRGSGSARPGRRGPRCWARSASAKSGWC